jgi:hypothetical protein
MLQSYCTLGFLLCCFQEAEQLDQQAPAVGQYRWRKVGANNIRQEFSGHPVVVNEAMKQPIQYFSEFFSPSLVEKITAQSNLFSVQQNGGALPVKITKEEIERYIGILLLMAIYNLPQYRMYWSSCSRVPAIAEAMTVNRFDILKRYLHFNDNSKLANGSPPDKLFKVRPLVDAVRSACHKISPEENMSIDEQVIPTKGRSPMRTYNPKKPEKWGMKVWARSGCSGIIYDFSIYTGKGDKNHGEYGLGGNVVLHLCKHLPCGQNFKIYFDNYFTGIPLLVELKEMGFLAVGTIRKNRLKGADKLMLSEREMKKQGRGSKDWRYDDVTGVTIVAWFDNACVTLASNYIGSEDGQPVSRFCGREKCRKPIPCPAIVNQYNKHMGGVDLSDMLMALYRVRVRTKKWYHHIFYYLLNLSVVNGWLLYRRDFSQHKPGGKQLNLLQFHCSIAESLLRCSLWRKRGRPSTPISATPLAITPSVNNNLHLPVFIESQGKCRLCLDKKETKMGYTLVKCSFCNVNLCLQKSRNCFFDYHNL